MGLFKRLYNMLVRDILYKIPKKYLIAILMFFLIFLFRSDVKAAYEVGGHTLPDLPTDINNYNYFITYNFNSNGYTIFMTSKNSDPAYVTLYGGFNCIRINPTWYGYNIVSGATSWGNLITQNNTRYDSYVEGLNPDNAEREYQSINCKRIIDANFNILYDYTTNKGGDIFYEASIAPYITNDLEDIQNWSFDYLLINGGTLKTSNEYGNNYFWLETIYNGNTTRIDIDPYYTTLNDTIYWTIPRNALLTNNAIINGNDVQFNIIEQRAVEGGRDYITYNLNIVTFDITQQEQDNINEDKTQQALDNISNAQQQTTNSINNFNNNFFNEDTSNINTNIVTPSVNSTEATSLLTLFNNTLNTWINLLEDTDGVQTINLYLPNFLDRTQPFTITLRSDIIKNVTNGINIPGFNFNVYNAIQIFWYLTLGGYLVHLLLRLYQAFTDGSITNLSSWATKINEEYTKISMFII